MVVVTGHDRRIAGTGHTITAWDSAANRVRMRRARAALLTGRRGALRRPALGRAGVVADEPARPDVQPAQSTTPTVRCCPRTRRIRTRCRRPESHAVMVCPVHRPRPLLLVSRDNNHVVGQPSARIADGEPDIPSRTGSSAATSRAGCVACGGGASHAWRSCGCTLGRAGSSATTPATSARAGSAGTAVPLPLARVLMSAGVVADEPARPDVQPAQSTTPTVRSAAPARDASARDVAAQSPMP